MSDGCTFIYHISSVAVLTQDFNTNLSMKLFYCLLGTGRVQVKPINKYNNKNIKHKYKINAHTDYYTNTLICTIMERKVVTYKVCKYHRY